MRATHREFLRVSSIATSRIQHALVRHIGEELVNFTLIDFGQGKRSVQSACAVRSSRAVPILQSAQRIRISRPRGLDGVVSLESATKGGIVRDPSVAALGKCTRERRADELCPGE